jgi:hypothetical protein
MIDLLQQGAPPVPPIIAPSADALVSTELRKFDPTQSAECPRSLDLVVENEPRK